MEQYPMFAHYENSIQPKGDDHMSMLWVIAVKEFKTSFDFFVVYFYLVVG